MASVILRPDATARAEWSVSDPALVNETLFQGDAAQNTFVVARKQDDESDLIYSFPTIHPGVSGTFTQATLKILAQKFGTVDNPDFSIYMNGWTANTTIPLTTSLAWHSISLPGSWTAPTGISLRLSSHAMPETGLPDGSGILIDCLYLSLDASGAFYGNSEFSLYTEGGTSTYPSSLIPLFISSPYQQNDSLSLFIESPLMSGDFPLYINSNIGSGETSFPLYTYSEAITADIFLFTAASGEEQYLPLYMSGGIALDSGSIPLYLFNNQQIDWNNVDLFVRGGVLTSGTSEIPLYIAGPIVSSTGVTNSFDIFLNATANSGMTKFFPLHMVGEGFGAGLPLYIGTDSVIAESSYMPLYLYNTADTSAAAFSLYISHSGANKAVPMYMFGAYNTNTYINLFLNNDNQGIDAIDLFVSGEMSVSNSGITLYTAGHDPIVSGVDLFIEGVSPTGYLSELHTLYTSGFRRGG